MLGDILGRKAGLGMDELFRFLPLAKGLGSILDAKLAEEAGLGGTGVEVELAMFISPLAWAELVGIVWSCIPRVSILDNVCLESITAGGKDISFMA